MIMVHGRGAAVRATCRRQAAGRARLRQAAGRARLRQEAGRAAARAGRPS